MRNRATRMHRNYPNHLKVNNTLTILGAIISFCSYICFYLLKEYTMFQGTKYVLWGGLCISISLMLFSISRSSNKDQSIFIYIPVGCFFSVVSFCYIFNFFFDDLIHTKVVIMTFLLIPVISVIWYFVKQLVK
jgi:drug/metabolite transporter (DMT)-like permease